VLFHARRRAGQRAFGRRQHEALPGAQRRPDERGAYEALLPMEYGGVAQQTKLVLYIACAARRVYPSARWQLLRHAALRMVSCRMRAAPSLPP
jgi:hypothetical protein